MKVIDYLEDLEIPVDIRPENSMSLTTLKQHARASYEKDNGPCYNDAAAITAREKYVDHFIDFLLTNTKVTRQQDWLTGIGPISQRRMTLNFGHSKNPNPKGGTYFAGRSNRSLTNPFNPED